MRDILKLELNKVTESYNKHKNIKKVSIELGYSESKVRKLLTTANINFSKKHHIIKQLFDEGYSVKEIANKLNMSEKVVNDYVPYRNYYYNDDKFRAKQTILNRKVMQRKKALNNVEDKDFLLKAFSEHRKYKYKYSNEGIYINNVLYSFETDEVKEIIRRIISDYK